MARSSIFSTSRHLPAVGVALLSLAAFSSCGDMNGGETGNDISRVQSELSGFAVTTRAYGNSRFGTNTGETALTTANVNIGGFAKLFTINVHDQGFAHPLDASGLPTAGG